MNKIFEHFYIVSTVLFTVYSQLIIKWQVNNAGQIPADMNGKISYIIALIFNPWVFSGIFATFLAGISWMMAMTKYEISYAYPFVSFNYVFILICGALFFGEIFTLGKFIGTFVIIIGILIIARG